MQDKVKGPAIALIILGGLIILHALAVLVMAVFAGAILNLPGAGMNANREQLEQLGPMLTVIYGAVSVFMIAVGGFVVFGGLRMMKLRSWTVALFAAIAGMVPCLSGYACLLGVPIGIWAIVVLSQADVKAAFQQNSLPPQ